ncbi:MAG: hypothetical protein E5V21_25340 [Mesorhizobium sp.]|nr:MAG: hypothetical protein E5V21_25340 [Mesorhizobium sp.]
MQTRSGPDRIECQPAAPEGRIGLVAPEGDHPAIGFGVIRHLEHDRTLVGRAGGGQQGLLAGAAIRSLGRIARGF